MVRRLRVLTAFVFWGVPAALGTAGAATFDLAADWSDVSNPAGVWTYREGANLLPHVSAWQGLEGDFTTSQPAWARFETGNMNLPCIFASSAGVAIEHDWLPGDVICHTTDPFNGVGSGPSNIAWTSPLDGVVSVTGGVWEGRDIGRSNHWTLSVMGVAVTDGEVASGDIYSRDDPFEFASGSGGPAALVDVAVSAGDEIVLLLEPTSSTGDYVGIRWTVTLTATGVRELAAADGLWLGAAAPNPFRNVCSIPFRIPGPGQIAVTIHDAAGRVVASPLRADLPAGFHTVGWDGRDRTGLPVASGAYFYRLTAGSRSKTGKLVIRR